MQVIALKPLPLMPRITLLLLKTVTAPSVVDGASCNQTVMTMAPYPGGGGGHLHPPPMREIMHRDFHPPAAQDRVLAFPNVAGWQLTPMIQLLAHGGGGRDVGLFLRAPTLMAVRTGLRPVLPGLRALLAASVGRARAYAGASASGLPSDLPF